MNDEVIPVVIIFISVMILSILCLFLGHKADSLMMELKEVKHTVSIYENIEGCSLPTKLIKDEKEEK